MTTTDANGIVFLQDTDNISPFHTLINGLQTATSTAIEKAGRGPFYAADNTARDALLTQHGASSSNPLWVDVAGTLERNAGSGWRSLLAQSGVVSVSSSAAAVSNLVTVTFPTPFLVAPRVVCQPIAAADPTVGDAFFLPSVFNVTAAGFQLRLWRPTGTVWSSGQNVHWIAEPV